MVQRTLNLCKEPAALATRAADSIIRAAVEAIRQRGRFTLALSGGATPEQTYELLAQPERAVAIDWSQTFLFFGDERCVPPEDERSNFRMVQRTLLARVAVASDHVFRIATQGKTAAESASAYTDELARFFSLPIDAAPPRFDLILLGLGEDGHTAALFPGALALRVADAWVTWTPPGRLPPPVDRITLTYPVLNAARRVVFLVTGAKKAAPLREVLEGQPDRERWPAAGVQPADGSVTWLVDAAAASLLGGHDPSCPVGGGE